MTVYQQQQSQVLCNNTPLTIVNVSEPSYVIDFHPLYFAINHVGDAISDLTVFPLIFRRNGLILFAILHALCDCRNARFDSIADSA